MNPSSLFIGRPVATTLLTLGLALAGIVAYALLPVAPLPQVDFPTIMVQASLPGASPETMASTVATPLERTLGVIAGVSEITSTSSQGSTRVILQFDLSRNIDGAAREVQAALNAARTLLPSGMPSNPTYRKVNPADAPVMILSLTSETMSRAQMYDAASTILAQKISQIEGIGQVIVGGAVASVYNDIMARPEYYFQRRVYTVSKAEIAGFVTARKEAVALVKHLRKRAKAGPAAWLRCDSPMVCKFCPYETLCLQDISPVRGVDEAPAGYRWAEEANEEIAAASPVAE